MSNEQNTDPKQELSEKERHKQQWKEDAQKREKGDMPGQKPAPGRGQHPGNRPVD